MTRRLRQNIDRLIEIVPRLSPDKKGREFAISMQRGLIDYDEKIAQIEEKTLRELERATIGDE